MSREEPVGGLAPRRPLLALEEVTTEFTTLNGTVRGVNGATYSVAPGETLGVVGESGSGKSVTVMSALGLLPSSGRVVSGRAMFDGDDLLTMSRPRLREVRGGEIGLIFQDPMTALNPVMTIGAQIDETLRRHSPELRTRTARRERILELLNDVGIPAPQQRVDQYPHQFSGGMRQRAMIAMAIANRPRLIIADEPTTALDVTVQAQILDLLQRMQDENGSAMVLITHDLGVIAEVAHRVVVMYAGRVVEEAPVDDIFHAPRHPYTLGLLESLPRVDDRRDVLRAIAGQPPDPRSLPDGCAFQPRCRLSGGRAECAMQPPLVDIGPGRRTACHFHAELAGADPAAPGTIDRDEERA
ncbi:ABC transporter ATP-binding protein [Mariniluteicoccus endophyticus]